MPPKHKDASIHVVAVCPQDSAHLSFFTEPDCEISHRMPQNGHLSNSLSIGTIPLTLTFRADDSAVTLFQNMWDYEKEYNLTLILNVTITLPAVSKRYVFKNGWGRFNKAHGDLLSPIIKLESSEISKSVEVVFMFKTLETFTL